MSNVFRISEDCQVDLDIFRSHYMTRIKKESKGSKFITALIEEKENYTDKQWLEFAVRFAKNHVDD